RYNFHGKSPLLNLPERGQGRGGWRIWYSILRQGAAQCSESCLRVDRLAVPAVAHHEPLQRRPTVGTILAVGPAERDDRRALDMVGNAKDFVDARLAPAVQGREHRSEPEGPRRQHEVLHARVD